MKRYLIIDGGTTNTRATLTDEHLHILAHSESNVGVRLTAEDGHNRRLRDAVQTCVTQALEGFSPTQVDGCFAYGMITSELGLCELPHLVAPVSAETLHAAAETHTFAHIAPFPITFLRGVRNLAAPVTFDNLVQMDMMRGEETEAIGLWTLLRPAGSCILVLPGSHNKFVCMDSQGCILGCMTSISGELLDALTHHTILSDAVNGQFVNVANYNRTLLLAGAAACDVGVGRAAFSARILRTLGGKEPHEVANFLLGVVLRTDEQAMQHFSLMQAMPDAVVYVAGKEPLQTALFDLLTAYGRTAHAVPQESSAAMGLAGALRIGTA